MKKSKFFAAAALLGAFGIGSLASCSNSQKAESDSIDSDTVAVEEPSVDTESVPAGYNAALFNDEKKKSDVPTDSTWTQTASGLKYAVVTEGTGESPKATDEVTVHYTGTLTDGTVFDSSVSRGEPTTFPLNRVIPGWTEGLQLMKTGGKTVFFIPAALAYGSQGVPGTIPPDAPLIFEVELISINK